MKLLYLDFLYPKSHLRLDINNINRLSKIAKVYVVSPPGRYKNLPPSVELIENKSIIVKKGKILERLFSLKTMILSAKITRKIKPDYIFISSYETIVFAIGRIFFRKNNNFILFHH